MEKKVDFKSCLFIAFDLDLTGNKIIDEMTNIGAYGMEEESRFKQYVIPHRNINIFATKRYLLKTANIHEFRVVKDCITRRAVKTKTEIFALFDFLNFLESLDTKKNGICLMHFESSKLVPFILLDALRRYKLLERFNRTVRGFADCHDFVKENCAATIPNFTLRTLVKILLNREKEKFHHAFERSKLIFEIVTHLCEGKSQNKAQDLALGVCPFVKTVDEVELELANMKEFLQKQYALTPLFLSQFKVSSLRLRALELRKLLITTDVTYETLKASFEEKNDTSEVLKAKLGEAATENDTTELVKIINAHFEKGPEEAKEERVSRYRKDSTRGKPSSSSAQKMTDEAPKTEKDTKEEVALPEPQTETVEVTDAQKPMPEVKTEPSPKSESAPGKSSKSDVSPKKKSDSAEKSPKVDTSSKPKNESSPKKSETPTKPKSADVKPKTAELKPKSADPKPKSAGPKSKSADPAPQSKPESSPKPKSADPAAQSKPESSPKPKSSDSSEPQQNDSPPKSETSALPENKSGSPHPNIKSDPQAKQAKIPPKDKPTPKPKQNVKTAPKSAGKKGAQPPPNGEPSATLPPASSPATATQAV